MQYTIFLIFTGALNVVYSLVNNLWINMDSCRRGKIELTWAIIQLVNMVLMVHIRKQIFKSYEKTSFLFNSSYNSLTGDLGTCLLK